MGSVITKRLAFNTRLRRCVSALALACSLALAPAPVLSADPPAKDGWGITYTDLTPDPAIRLGTLPNGLKYAIMKNGTPKGAASVRLHFAFGSIAEGDREQGLAHFIEHMAFNGSTNVPEGDMLKILQRQGLAFGADTNASTGFDATTYMLELPKADKERLDTAMFLLREVASEVKFDPAAVDRERGVILSEKRTRDGFQLRQALDVVGFQLPNTPYATRFPIGTEAVLKNATAQEMRSLYRRYYRPENATLVFVGDADPAEIEQRIGKSFGDWKVAAPAGAPLPRGTIDTKRPAAFDTFADPAVATTIIYTITRPWIDPPDSLSERERTMIETVAENLLNRRLQRLANLPGSAILGGGMSEQQQKEAGLLTSLNVVTKDGAWKEGIRIAEQEVRRTLRYGFTASELKTELADMDISMRTAVERANTRPNAALAGMIVGSVGQNDFITTPAFRYELFKKLRPGITPARVHAAFRHMWTGSAPLIHVSSKLAVKDSEVAAAFTASRKLAIAPPAEVSAKAFAYDNFGPPGAIVDDKRVTDLDVRTVRFANNVRLNLKKTDFEAGRVRFTVRMGNGQLDLPLDKPGLGLMMSLTSGLGGLKKHSMEELKEISAGKVVTFGAGVSEAAFVASGSTRPDDLALQMKLSAAYLTDPGFRPEAANQWANTLPIIDKQFDSRPQSVAGARLPTLLANGDARFGLPSRKLLEQRNFGEAQAALAPLLASAPIEVTLVGDIDEAKAIAAVAASFGALPARRLASPPSSEALKASFRKDRAPILLKHDGLADQALIGAAWPTDDDSDHQRVIGLSMLAGVLDLMLLESVREKLGSSYGVAIANNMSGSFPDFGYLMTSSVVAPDKMDEVQKAFEESVAELRDKPVDADLLARARTPALENIDRSRRENGFWINALDEAQSRPDRLDRIRNQRAMIQAVTPADIQKLARQYLTPDKLQLVRITSSKLATTAAR